MALDATVRLSIAELVIYIFLVPIVVYILIRHGKPGYLGWGFIIVFCGLRLASDGIEIAQHNSLSGSSSGAIINAIGLSGLLYGLAGILHEWFVVFCLSRQGYLALHSLTTHGETVTTTFQTTAGKRLSASNSSFAL